uniref:CSON010163 protein n=1 Tax=Culicoides sonorensis TaxID=179676 RepID=A0A336LPK2_CULSO
MAHTNRFSITNISEEVMYIMFVSSKLISLFGSGASELQLVLRHSIKKSKFVPNLAAEVALLIFVDPRNIGLVLYDPAPLPRPLALELELCF